MYVLWLACDRRCLMCVLGVSLWALNLCQTLFSLFCWPSVFHCRPIIPAQLQRESFVFLQFTLEYLNWLHWWSGWEFFLPHPMGDVEKRLFPAFVSGGSGFEFMQFPLVHAVHWDGVNLLKLGDGQQLATEPEQNRRNQYTLSPLQLRGEISMFHQSYQICPFEPSHIFTGNKAPLKTSLWISPVTTQETGSCPVTTHSW